MNFFKKSIYALSLVGMAGLWSCSQEEMLQGGSEPALKGSPVKLTLTVNRGDAQTRTLLTENDATGGLFSEWSKGDVLYVYDSQKNRLGELTLETGEGTPVGVFSGNITAEEGKHTLTFWYFNEDDSHFSVEADGTGTRVVVDVTAQSFFSLEELSVMDLMSSKQSDEYDEVPVMVKDGKATVMQDVSMVSKLAMARFSLSGLPEDAEGTLQIYDADNKLYIKDGFGIVSTYSESKLAGGEGACINVSGVTYANSDVYVALIPNRFNVDKYRLGFKFTDKNTEKVYTYEFTEPTEVRAGIYYTSFNKEAGADTGTFSGIPVALTPEQTEEPEQPVTPVVDEDLVGPVFEVDGKKFRFTRANLQYNTVAKEYLIPEKQTDFTVTSGHRIGWTNTTTGNPEYIGLFRWGATGIEDDVWKPWPADYWSDVAYFKSAANIHGTLPCQTSGNNATISTNKTLCPNGVAQDTPYDWGKAYSAQKNDGSHYFTLTSKELIAVIDNTVSVCGTVDNIEGLVILPYEDAEAAKTAITTAGGKYNQLYKLPKSIVNDGTNYGSSDRSKFAWTHLTLTYDQLTALNGIFLPAAGMNNPSTGSNPKMVSSDYKGKCYYWTSTPTSTPNAIHLYVNGEATTQNRVFKVYGYGKGYGLSVRLVKEIKDNTSTEDTVGPEYSN